MFRAKDRDTLNSIHHNAASAGMQQTHASQLKSISQAQDRNHEFIAHVLGSLEGRIMEMQSSQIRWIEMYEQQLQRLETGQSVLKADLDALSAKIDDYSQCNTRNIEVAERKLSERCANIEKRLNEKAGKK